MLFFDEIRVLITCCCLFVTAGLVLVLLAFDAIRHLSHTLSRCGLALFALSAAIATVEAQKRGPMRVPQRNDGNVTSPVNDSFAQGFTVRQEDRPFRIASYSISNGTNYIGMAWNPSSLPMGKIEVAVTDALTNGWRYFGSWQMMPSQTNIEICVAPSELGLNVDSEAFVMVAPSYDADGDGLTDFQELYSLGTSPAITDTDGDGLSDGRELQLGCDPFCIDTDGDHIDDGLEDSHGVDPADRDSYCFSPVFIISNQTDRVSLIKAAFGEVVVPLTNECNVVNGGHVHVDGGDKPELFVFIDINTNGICEANEKVETFPFPVTRHSFTNYYRLTSMDMDRDRDDIPDWWETVHGLSCTNKNDAVLDYDGDGLINLHEYWAGTDPFVYDGTNTALYAAVHGVDDKLIGKTPSISWPMFVNYKSNLRMHSPPNVIENDEFWLGGRMQARFSVSKDHPVSYFGGSLNPISPQHVLIAKHCDEPTNIIYRFKGISGLWHERMIKAKMDVDSIAGGNLDMTIGLLNEALPTNDVVITGILPKDYACYLGELTHIPVIQYDQDMNALVCDIVDTVKSPARYGEFSCGRSKKALRNPFYQAPVLYDSGSPCFVMLGEDPVLLYTLHARSYVNGEYVGRGNHPALYVDEIQDIMNSLSDEFGMNRYSVKTYDLSVYPKINERGRK